MAIFKPYKIQSSQLEDLPVVEGQFIATTDTQKLYLDKDSVDRIELCDTDLTGYVKNTDYATSSIAGVIKPSTDMATTVSGSSGKLRAEPISYSDFDNFDNRAFISKGTLNNVLTGRGYTTNTGTITGVSVNGTSIATSGTANITSVPASILTGSIPSAVTATTQSQGDGSTKVATTAYVDTAISNLPDPMVFKGSLGTGGTITALPVDGSANVGDTYKVITAGTYASKAADVGDTFICLTKTSSANTWELIPSGDEPDGTVTSVTLQATTPIVIDDSTAITTSGTRTFTHATSGVTAGTYNSVTVDTYGHVTTGSNPTTLAGYGITDASISSQTVTLGTNSVTVPTKTSDLVNDMNFMSGMTILSYGHSTWDDFITAYTAKHVVYTRASSGSNPGSGSQTRLAFMAYVNNADSPTEVEFQYYRSVSSHNNNQQGDQTYVYKLNKTNGWSVTVRENYTKVVGSDGITGTWSSGTLTLKHDASGVTAGTYNSVTVDAKGHVTAGSNPTTLSGYGITDAKIDSGVITLGSNTITPLTSADIGAAATKAVDTSISAASTSTNLPTSQAVASFVEGKGYVTTDTKNTAGSTYSASKIYLIGATSQAENPQTYSNNKLYYNNGLYSQATAGQGNTMVTINQSSSGITLEYDNGYEDHKIVMNSTGIALEGVKAPTNDSDAANKKYVDDAIAAATPTIPNADNDTVGGLKVRLDDNTHTLYITNNGQDA